MKTPNKASAKVYAVDAEVEILPESETYNGEGQIFAFVYGFCLASSNMDAVGRIKADLKQQDIVLMRVTSIRLAEDFDWKGSEHESADDMNNYIKEAQTTNEVIYGVFYCFPKEDKEE